MAFTVRLIALFAFTVALALADTEVNINFDGMIPPATCCGDTTTGCKPSSPCVCPSCPVPPTPQGLRYADFISQRYGPADRLGTLNTITPAKVLQASSLIRQGKVLHMQRGLRNGATGFGGRVLSAYPKGGPTGAVADVVYNELALAGELEQIWSQVDWQSHIGARIFDNNGSYLDVYYNGIIGHDAARAELSTYDAPGIFTRGILIDIAGHRGVDVLPDNTIVGAAEVQAILASKGLALQSGDAVFFRYGMNTYFDAGQLDKWTTATPPGISEEVLDYLITKDIAIIGGDSWPVEALPSSSGKVFPVHVVWIVKYGGMIIENAVLEHLAAAQVYEFAFSFAPLKVALSSGSPFVGQAIY